MTELYNAIFEAGLRNDHQAITALANAIDRQTRADLVAQSMVFDLLDLFATFSEGVN